MNGGRLSQILPDTGRVLNYIPITGIMSTTSANTQVIGMRLTKVA